MRKIFACLFVIALAACSSDETPAVKPALPPVSKMNLDVLTIDVVDQSAPQDADSPYASNNFQPTIAAALKQWAEKHYAASGTTGEATITIKDARLTSEALPHNDDMFTRAQAGKYTAHAQVELAISGHEGHAEVSAEASRYETLLEKPTPIEKQNAYTKILNGIVHDLGANLDTGIKEHAGDFIITAPILDKDGNALLPAPFTYHGR